MYHLHGDAYMEYLEGKKKMISEEAIKTTAKLVGQYIVDHADELILTEYSDLFGDEIFIRIIRRKDICKGTGEQDGVNNVSAG